MNLEQTLENLDFKFKIKCVAEDLNDLLLEYREKYKLSTSEQSVFDSLIVPLAELQVDEIF